MQSDKVKEPAAVRYAWANAPVATLFNQGGLPASPFRYSVRKALQSANFHYPMPPNPFFGIIFHWLGGLAAASFYIPYGAVKRWSWGDLLAGWWSLQLDRGPVVFALPAGAGLASTILLSAPPSGMLVGLTSSGVLLGRGRTYLWPHRCVISASPLAWAVPSGFLRGLRHA